MARTGRTDGASGTGMFGVGVEVAMEEPGWRATGTAVTAAALQAWGPEQRTEGLRFGASGGKLADSVDRTAVAASWRVAAPGKDRTQGCPPAACWHDAALHGCATKWVCKVLVPGEYHASKLNFLKSGRKFPRN